MGGGRERIWGLKDEEGVVERGRKAMEASYRRAPRETEGARTTQAKPAACGVGLPVQGLLR